MMTFSGNIIIIIICSIVAIQICVCLMNKQKREWCNHTFQRWGNVTRLNKNNYINKVFYKKISGMFLAYLEYLGCCTVGNLQLVGSSNYRAVREQILIPLTEKALHLNCSTWILLLIGFSLSWLGQKSVPNVNETNFAFEFTSKTTDSWFIFVFFLFFFALRLSILKPKLPVNTSS